MEEKKIIDSQKRKRGLGFPSITLLEAEKFLKNGASAGWVMPKQTFAKILGLSANSGSFLLRLAALRDYGLIEKGEDVTYSALGRTLVVPLNQEDRTEALKKALKNASIFWDLYEHLSRGQGKTDAEVIANLAVAQCGVNFKRRNEFAKNFIESAVAGKLMKNDGQIITIIDAENKVIDSEKNPREGIERAIVEPIAVEETDKKNFVIEEDGVHWSFRIKSKKNFTMELRSAVLKIAEILEKINAK